MPHSALDGFAILGDALAVGRLPAPQVRGEVEAVRQRQAAPGQGLAVVDALDRRGQRGHSQKVRNQDSAVSA